MIRFAALKEAGVLLIDIVNEGICLHGPKAGSVVIARSSCLLTDVGRRSLTALRQANRAHISLS